MRHPRPRIGRPQLVREGARRLPLIELTTHTTSGASDDARVLCPRRDASIDVDECALCGHLASHDVSGGVVCGSPEIDDAPRPVEPTISRVLRPRADALSAELSAKEGRAIMTERGLRELPVVDADGHPIGVVGEAELALLDVDGSHAQVGEVVRGQELRAFESSSIRSVASKMVEASAQTIPIVDDAGVLVGTADAFDVLRSVASSPRAPSPFEADARRTQLQAVLVADVDTLEVDRVGEALFARGFSARVAATQTALDAALTAGTPPCAIVIGRPPPTITTAELLRRIRATPTLADAGVIVLAPGADEPERVLALELGADDILAAPVSPRELALRVRSVARRAPTTHLTPETPSDPLASIRWFGLELDPSVHVVRAGGHRVELRPMEYRFLELLMRHPGRVLTRERILRELWPDAQETSPRTIDTHVRRLRDALGTFAGAIETVHSFGYRLRDPRANIEL